MTLSPQAMASLVRFGKVTLFGAIVLAVDGAITFLTANSLGLAPTYQSVVQLVAVPVLAAAQKWATWQEAQP
jgi:hypothetical protein